MVHKKLFIYEDTLTDKRLQKLMGTTHDDYFDVVPGFGEGGVHQMNIAGDDDPGTGGGFNSFVEAVLSKHPEADGHSHGPDEFGDNDHHHEGADECGKTTAQNVFQMNDTIWLVFDCQIDKPKEKKGGKIKNKSEKWEKLTEKGKELPARVTDLGRKKKKKDKKKDKKNKKNKGDEVEVPIGDQWCRVSCVHDKHLEAHAHVPLSSHLTRSFP